MKVLNYTGLQNLWTNIRNYITAHTPTKTSDLTNDSNFVDTSNPAVSSGITSAKVTDYDTHIADTDIHVTTADKTKWNNGVSQSYVLRYSSSSVTDNSTIAFSTLDNTDNIKASDKIIDVDGKIFSIVSVDTANSTVTVGSALIDLALDANVVHTSGNETISGTKTFSNLQIIAYGTQYKGARDAYILPEFSAGYSGLSITTLSYPQTLKIGNFVLDANNKPSLDTSKGYMQIATGENNGVNACTLEARNSTYSSLGTSANRWSKIYGTEYYYGSNNVEFSTKFVTTDTAQTISGVKTFSSSPVIYNYDTTATAPQILFKNSKTARGSTTETGAQLIYFADKNNTGLGMIENRVISNGSTSINIVSYNTDADNNTVSGGISIIKSPTNTNFAPTTDNAVTCGRPLAKWSDVQTYKVNNLEPSSLSLPSGNASDVIDISSYIIDLSGGINEYTASVNGWITITCLGCTGIKFSITNFWANGSYRENPNQISCMIPICKGQKVGIYIYGSSPTIQAARFIPCQGNV